MIFNITFVLVLDDVIYLAQVILRRVDIVNKIIVIVIDDKNHGNMNESMRKTVTTTVRFLQMPPEIYVVAIFRKSLENTDLQKIAVAYFLQNCMIIFA